MGWGGGATDETFPAGEAGLEAGAAPGLWLRSGWEQMAPDPRVPAAAAAPRERPASVRRGGCTRRGGRSSNIFSPSLWFLSAWGWSFTPRFFRRPWRCRRSKFCPFDCWTGVRTTCATDLEKSGRKTLTHLLSGEAEKEEDPLPSRTGLPRGSAPRTLGLPAVCVVAAEASEVPVWSGARTRVGDVFKGDAN